jgi:hypothetical protein
VVTPEGPLEASDFKAIAKLVDPIIESTGDLNGLLIDAPTFPGWKGFSDQIAHFRFVKDHQRHIAKVAAVTDSSFLRILSTVAGHFTHADVRHFTRANRSQAMAWLEDDA